MQPETIVYLLGAAVLFPFASCGFLAMLEHKHEQYIKEKNELKEEYDESD